MTRADRLYRVWLERELGRITAEEAWERVDEVLASAAPKPRPLRPRPAYSTCAVGPKIAAMKAAA